MKAPTQITATLILLALASGLLAARSPDIFADRKRQNFFDPIYAYDDIDAHTISLAGSAGRQVPAGTGEQAQPASAVSSFVAAKRNSSEPDPARAAQKRRSPFEDLVAGPVKGASERPKLDGPTTGYPVVQAALTLDSRPYASGDLSINQLAQKQRPAEKHHWSGLENYYRALQLQHQRQRQQVDDPIYQISQEPAPNDGQIGLTLWQGSNQQQQQQPSKGLIVFPGYNAGQPTNRPQSNFEFGNLEPSYAPQAFAGPNHQGAVKGPPDALLTNPLHYPGDQEPVAQGIKYGVSLSSLSRDDLRRILQREQSMNRQQVSERRDYPLVDLSRPLSPPPPPSFVAQEKRPFFLANSGQIVQEAPPNSRDYLEIQRQRNRYMHQQQTLGELYDSQRLNEQYLEDIHCRAQRLANLRPAPSHSNANGTVSGPSQLRIDPSGSLSQEATAHLSVGEFPSHMGIYNGTPDDNNFLCAASWIQDGFALTLATCVDSVNPKTLVARFGEWNLNKPNSSQQQQSKLMITTSVREIITFPKYQKNNSLEHNLALIRLEQPFEFYAPLYARPACQKDSRNSLQGPKSCWSPVRNATFSEYFDAEGEGETRLKKSVAMIEVPVKLITDDDAECARQSGADLFNFNHPNYICSADFRKAPWRAKLNQSDYFGSGIYCNDGGSLSLVSMIHPIGKNSSSAIGYLDLSYYRPWMRNVIFAQY